MTRTTLSRSKGQMSGSPGRFTHLRVNASGSCSGQRGNVLVVGNYILLLLYTATLRQLGGARRFGAHRWRRGAGHIVAAAHLQLVVITISANEVMFSSALVSYKIVTIKQNNVT